MKRKGQNLHSVINQVPNSKGGFFLIKLSANLKQDGKTHAEREVIFYAGGKNSKVKVKISNTATDKNTFTINPENITELLLARISQPLAFYRNEKENLFKIGPVLGILSGIPVVMMNHAAASLYKTIAETAYRSGIICYFFTPDLIDFEKNIITGFKYRFGNPFKKGWIMQDFPMPDVIYNQTGSISEELKPAYSKLMLEYLVKNENVHSINPFMGLQNKLVTHDTLISNSSIRKYLPETKACNSFSTILYFLEKYRSVYLKPNVSSLGMGIYKVIAANNKDYTIDTRLKMRK